jgi:hypothetical protein
MNSAVNYREGVHEAEAFDSGVLGAVNSALQVGTFRRVEASRYFALRALAPRLGIPGLHKF